MNRRLGLLLSFLLLLLAFGPQAWQNQALPQTSMPEVFFLLDTPPESVTGEYAVAEAGGATKTIKVKLSSPAPMGGCTVGYGNDPGTAMPGPAGFGDYLAFAGTLTFKAGEDEKSFTVTVHDDSLSEGNEYFYVKLVSPSGCALGNPSKVKFWILDDEKVEPIPPPIELEINAVDFPGSLYDDNFVFMTPEDATETIYAPAYAKLKYPASAPVSVDISNEAGGGDLWCAPCAGPVTYSLLDLARRFFHASRLSTFLSR